MLAKDLILSKAALIALFANKGSFLQIYFVVLAFLSKTPIFIVLLGNPSHNKIILDQ